MILRRITLASNWNTLYDLNTDQTGLRAGTNNPDTKPFGDFTGKLDLVDKFRNERSRNLVLRGKSGTVARTLIEF